MKHTAAIICVTKTDIHVQYTCKYKRASECNFLGAVSCSSEKEAVDSHPS